MTNMVSIELNQFPIILIHTGNSWYLPYTIWQLKKTNPDTNIYLIGDRQNKHYQRWINHINISTFNGATSNLQKVYKHKSTLGEEFEFQCIARWFILLEFMKQRNIEQCVYLDSDILVYNNLSKVESSFPKYDMTWCGFSAHTNYIKNRVTLENYCNNILDCYSDNFPEKLKEKSLFYQVISAKTEMNISDMTFWHDYNVRYPNSLLDISLPNLNGTFDRSMEDTRVFEMKEEGFKKINWQNNKPNCKEIESGILYPFITLHFQGRGKQVLKKHFKYNSIRFKILCSLNHFHLFVFKIIKRLK